MSQFNNPRKQNFLDSVPIASFENIDDNIAARCKFNFSYFSVPPERSGFENWSQENLVDLIDKLKEYGKYPLTHWMGQRIGRSGTVLSIYQEFPKKSRFTFPKHVPHQAHWGRFRLDWSGRLCGFVIPNQYINSMQASSGHRFDCNTFYVVFIDEDHEFYIGREPK